jgi:hypothetical protein
VPSIPVTFDKPRSLTDKDELLQTVKQFIKARRPDIKLLRQRPDWSELEGFYRSCEALTTEQGCVMFRERVVIPSSLRNQELKLLHRGQPGIQRMKSLARNYAYWPCMDQDIEKVVRKCAPCSILTKQPIKAALHSWPPATKSCQRIHLVFTGPYIDGTFSSS